MAKGKKKGQTGPNVDTTIQSMASVSISGDSKPASLFPLKPKRTGPPVGRPVQLISNLFKMSMTTKKPIYRFDVNVDIEQQEAELASPRPAGGADPVARKLNKEIRKQAIDQAIKIHIQETSPIDMPKNIKYTYVYDSNGSVLYSLFDMFASNKDAKSQEYRTSVSLETILDGKVGRRDQFFRVKLFRNDMKVVNLNKLFEFCKGTGISDITTIQESIRAVNIFLHGEVINIPRFVVTPTSVFDYKKENQFTISPKVLINKGFSMSARPTAVGLVMNVANSFNAFHEETDLIGMLQARFNVRDLSQPLNSYVMSELKKEIKNKQIEARHINYGTKQKPHFRKYRVSDIGGNSEEKFTLVDKEKRTSREVKIKDYFKEEYKVTIKYPKLPCIIDKGRKIPLEVCHLIDKQRVTRKMTPDETAETIKMAALRPEQYFANVREHVKTIGNLSQPLKDFGLDFDAQPIEVEGRELRPTNLMGKSMRNISPNDGQYDARREQFLKPAQINKWCVMVFVDQFMLRHRESNYYGTRFADIYKMAAMRKGLKIGDCIGTNSIELTNKPEHEIRMILKKYFAHLNKEKVDHAIFLLPGSCPDYMYRYLQFLETCQQSDRKLGESYTRISCVKFQNYLKKIIESRDNGEMFIANLLLKYNTKLGGINFALIANPDDKFLKEGYIFISLDVCHPAPGDKLIQSVAAAVGMWDLNNPNWSYRTSIRVQHKVRKNNSTIEDVGQIDLMFEDILKSYWLRKKKLPSNIVVLRDGVSEGQFKIVLESELMKVHALLTRIYTNMKQPSPKLTCMIVQKRHKIRFMRKVPFQGRKGPDYNVQPGTVVDSTITHPTDFSFYLAPHKGIQGTSRAAHIYVICDQIGFSQDEAQSMIHALSYLSPRCNKSTSIPTPVNLADLAAERGKNLVICWNEEHKEKMLDDERLSALNDYLTNKLADANYRNTLFYI